MKLNKKIVLARTILELSLEITLNSDIDIFVDFSSHVKSFSIKIILNGWSKNGYETDYQKSLYLDRNCETDLIEIIAYLEFIKEEIE